MRSPLGPVVRVQSVCAQRVINATRHGSDLPVASFDSTRLVGKGAEPKRACILATQNKSTSRTHSVRFNVNKPFGSLEQTHPIPSVSGIFNRDSQLPPHRPFAVCLQNYSAQQSFPEPMSKVRRRGVMGVDAVTAVIGTKTGPNTSQQSLSINWCKV